MVVKQINSVSSSNESRRRTALYFSKAFKSSLILMPLDIFTLYDEILPPILYAFSVGLVSGVFVFLFYLAENFNLFKANIWMHLLRIPLISIILTFSTVVWFYIAGRIESHFLKTKSCIKIMGLSVSSLTYLPFISFIFLQDFGPIVVLISLNGFTLFNSFYLFSSFKNYINYENERKASLHSLFIYIYLLPITTFLYLTLKTSESILNLA